VATIERIRHEKNRDAGRFRLAFFARGNQPEATQKVMISINAILPNVLSLLTNLCPQTSTMSSILDACRFFRSNSPRFIEKVEKRKTQIHRYYNIISIEH
jgi:hypothetical protein